MNKEQITYPKYSPGQNVLSTLEWGSFGGKIKSILFSPEEGWVYFLDIDGLEGFREKQIIYILNAGYWVKAEEWNPHREFDAEKVKKDIYDEMLETDPEEEAFIAEQRKIFEDSKVLRDESPQGEDGTDEKETPKET